MRTFLVMAICLVFSVMPLRAEDKKTCVAPAPRPNYGEIDKQLFDSLKEIHNRGADIFNSGDPAACYRLFQGCLLTTKAVLIYRPDEQKFIVDSMADAERETSISRRAFMLHESIEKLRTRLKATIQSETLTFPPRELKDEKNEAPKPPILIEPKSAKENSPKIIVPMAKEKKDEPAKPLPAPPKDEKKESFKPPLAPKEGFVGRVYWRGVPLAGVDILFVSRDHLDFSVLEAKSDAYGYYVVEKALAKKYSVLLTMPVGSSIVLPERFATTTTSPLIIEVKGGDSLDFVLQ